MKKLIFLPIELDIRTTEYHIETKEKKTFNGLWNTKFISSTHPELSTIINQLPFSMITMVKYNTQTSDIPPHIDVQKKYIRVSGEYEDIRSNEPAGYRILLCGSPTKLEVFDGKEWIVSKLPLCPFGYVINSTDTKHRIIGETGRNILYFRGFLDRDKHIRLINKNLEKYREYAIYSQ